MKLHEYSAEHEELHASQLYELNKTSARISLLIENYLERLALLAYSKTQDFSPFHSLPLRSSPHSMMVQSKPTILRQMSKLVGDGKSRILDMNILKQGDLDSDLGLSPKRRVLQTMSYQTKETVSSQNHRVGPTDEPLRYGHIDPFHLRGPASPELSLPFIGHTFKHFDYSPDHGSVSDPSPKSQTRDAHDTTIQRSSRESARDEISPRADYHPIELSPTQIEQ